MPPAIKPPFIRSKSTTRLDRSFGERAKAIIESTTALPPNPAPLTDSFNWRNPELDTLCVGVLLDDRTSAAYIINKASEIKRRMMDILVLITNLFRVFLINIFYLTPYYPWK